MSTPPAGRAYAGPPSHSVNPPVATIDPRLKQLADNLKRLTYAAGLNSAEVARLLKLDKSAVSRWFTGERTPTLQNLIEMAALLGVEMDDLWRGPEAVPATPEQQAMLQRMSKMTPEQQQALLALAATMTGLPK
jgi:transcriptional regulator with XRE-family HTH domain